MSWSNVFKLAAALFVAQISLGFVEGVVVPPSEVASFYLVGNVVSFFVCAVIFGYFAACQRVRPFTHASLGLLVQCLLGALLYAMTTPWVGGTPKILIAIEWLVLVCALVIGTFVGIRFQYSGGKEANA